MPPSSTASTWRPCGLWPTRSARHLTSSVRTDTISASGKAYAPPDGRGSLEWKRERQRALAGGRASASRLHWGPGAEPQRRRSVGTADAFNPFESGYVESPYKPYARLRADDPVHWSDLLEGWVLTRYDDIAHVLREPTISVELDNATPTNFVKAERTR